MTYPDTLLHEVELADRHAITRAAAVLIYHRVRFEVDTRERFLLRYWRDEPLTVEPSGLVFHFNGMGLEAPADLGTAGN